MPDRIQLSRRKGWRKPANTVSVARPGNWGNPYPVQYDPLWNGGRIHAFTGKPIVMAGPWQCAMPRADGTPSEAGWWFQTREDAARKAIELFRARLEIFPLGAWMRANLHELRGKNLACWCPLGQPCHADVLLELANREGEQG
jgi:hypothetical protein